MINILIKSDDDITQSIMICPAIDTVDDHFCGYP